VERKRVNVICTGYSQQISIRPGVRTLSRYCYRSSWGALNHAVVAIEKRYEMRDLLYGGTHDALMVANDHPVLSGVVVSVHPLLIFLKENRRDCPTVFY
jgi:hypothetical protein